MHCKAPEPSTELSPERLNSVWLWGVQDVTGTQRRDTEEREEETDRREKREKGGMREGGLRGRAGTGEETAALSSAPRARIYRMKEGRGTWGRHVGGAAAEGR